MSEEKTFLGRYEIQRELGKGAMGIVYEALDPAIGRRVALKTILRQQGIPPEEEAMRQERFQREARAAGVLSHPNIVTVYDVGEDAYSGTTFFAMEFIAGDDLSKVLKHRGPLSAEEVINIVAQVADALDYAHKGGIVHRDVKPANVVLMPSGRVKVTDFGIAKLDSSTLTQTGAYLGTPTFMAPEMIAGRGVEGSADQFSLGVVTYQLLTNAKPFSGENLATLSYQIVNKDPTPVRAHRPDLPEEIEQVFLTVLAKKSSDRYPSCMDFVADLKSVLLPHDESTIDYADQTRPAVGAGPGSAKVRTVGGPGTGRVRTVPAGPGTGRVRTVAPSTDSSMATRMESTQSTLSTVGGTGGILIGVAAGAVVVLGLILVAAAWFFLRPGTGRVAKNPTPTATVPTPTPTPIIVETPTPTPTPTITEVPPQIPTEDPEAKLRKERNDARWNSAIGAHTSGDYDKAIAELTALLRDDPGYPGALDLLEKARKARADERQKAEDAKKTPPPTQVAVATPTPRPKDPEPADDPLKNGGGDEGDEQSAGSGSALTINFEHRLSGGRIRVFVDGAKVVESSFSGTSDPVVKFKKFSIPIGRESTFHKTVDVSPGEHTVKVEISGDDVSTSGSISGSFKDGRERTLVIGVGNVDRKIELEWE